MTKIKRKSVIKYFFIQQAVAVAFLVTLWWFLRRRREMGSAVPEIKVFEKDTTTPPVVAVPEPVRDDLRKIEGIGPKISSLLQTAGIHTYAHLAAREPSQLREILTQAGIRLANPETWPEQASLAAAGNWEELRALQAQLKGGRRVN